MDVKIVDEETSYELSLALEPRVPPKEGICKDLTKRYQHFPLIQPLIRERR
jgi:hypothetical protein